MTRSTAYSKLNVWTEVWPSRAACSAASLQMLAISAPVRTTGERRVSALLPWGLRGGKKGGAHKQVKGGQGARYRQRGVVRAGRWCSCSPRLKPFNTSDPKNHLSHPLPPFSVFLPSPLLYCTTVISMLPRTTAGFSTTQSGKVKCQTALLSSAWRVHNLAST